MANFVGYRLYCLRRNFPRRLLYPSAAVDLEIVQTPGPNPQHWEFRARKLQLNGAVLVIRSSCFGKWHLERELFHDGFVIRTSEPSARIMERLVHEGAAEAHWVRNEESRR